MRTVGTFADVYQAARDYYLDQADDCPMDPVIRRTDDEWALESGIYGEPNATFQCQLEVFDRFFYEAYTDPDYFPSEDDVTEFLQLFE